MVADRLEDLVERYLDGKGDVRGKGMMLGIAMSEPELAAKISSAAFARGLIVETCGPRNEVLKLLPPLTIELDTLSEGLGHPRGGIRRGGRRTAAQRDRALGSCRVARAQCRWLRSLERPPAAGFRRGACRELPIDLPYIFTEIFVSVADLFRLITFSMLLYSSFEKISGMTVAQSTSSRWKLPKVTRRSERWTRS